MYTLVFKNAKPEDVLTTTGSLVSTFMGLQPAVPLERLEFSGVYFTFSNNVLLGYVFVLLIGINVLIRIWYTLNIL